MRQGASLRAMAVGVVGALALSFPSTALANDQQPGDAANVAGFSMRELLDAGGTIGYLIIALSFTMVYLVVEHLLTIRRKALVPPDVAASVHQHLVNHRLADAQQACKAQPSFLSHIIGAGLSVADLEYEHIEKAMEDAAAQHSARLYRKIEYLPVIGTVAPMLGLLGTVWGMIMTFREFEAKAHPAVAELAPGIYRALVTTLFGLWVAIPAFGIFALLRNRLDELIAEGALTAEHVFADLRRERAKPNSRLKPTADALQRQAPRPSAAAPEREPQS